MPIDKSAKLVLLNRGPGAIIRSLDALSRCLVRYSLGTRLKLHDRSTTDTQSSHFRRVPVNIGEEIRMSWLRKMEIARRHVVGQGP